MLVYVFTTPFVLIGLFILNRLNQMKLNHQIENIEKMKENEISKNVHEEYEEIIKTLEEGLAVFEDMNLKLNNDSFKRFIKDLEEASPSSEISNNLIDLKIFRIYNK